ncbi:MAG: sugar phosphate isomerase/epimerase [Roseivirga sp.]|nr:sugar phosphate isomerase/epimerase [Roseivirga sp.]
MKKRASLLTVKAIAALFLFFSLYACGSGSKSAAESESVASEAPDFQISLAQWSLHRKYFGDLQARGGWQWFGKTLRENPDALIQEGEDPMDFPALAASYGVNSIELVNTFYYGKANDMEYWKAFKQKCDEAGVSVGLIMCDALGDLGNADDAARAAAVQNHHAWIDIAKYLGAHTIRVNAAGSGTAEEVASNAVDGLSKLGEYGASQGINVVVENHGGYSSDGAWLADVMKRVNMDNVGTLPDFGNFCIENGPDGCVNEYDRYKGIEELMPYAKAVSAKAHMFDEQGNEVNSDFSRIMKIVKAAGFKGHVGIEYEGKQLSEDEGIKATKALLEKVFAQLD